MNFRTFNFNNYFLRYMQLSDEMRKACRDHWEFCHEFNTRKGLKGAAANSAEYLEVIHLADKILAGEI